MNRSFPGEGTFAKIDGEWRKAFSYNPSLHHDVRVPTNSARHPTGEISRVQRNGYQLVSVDPATVDEVVNVTLHGRYRGAAVILGNAVTDGMMYVYPESMDRHEAAALDFDGDERISGFSKRVHADEVTDVLEEVEVIHRRGVPPL